LQKIVIDRSSDLSCEHMCVGSNQALVQEQTAL
jgi:hypothetical protein